MHKPCPCHIKRLNSRITAVIIFLIIADPPLLSLHSDHVCMDPLRSGLPVPRGHEDAATPPLGCHLPSAASATRHPEVVATLLRGSGNSSKDLSFPAAATGSRLQANLRHPLLLGSLCRSTCSVLSETICRKHVGSTTSAGTQSILSPLWSTWTHTTASQIHTNLNSNNFQQTQINTHRQQENLQPILSARHCAKSAFFKWSHLALRTFCHAAAGIWLQ